jgi:hypothetical protein
MPSAFRCDVEKELMTVVILVSKVTWFGRRALIMTAMSRVRRGSILGGTHIPVDVSREQLNETRPVDDFCRDAIIGAVRRSTLHVDGGAGPDSFASRGRRHFAPRVDFGRRGVR